MMFEVFLLSRLFFVFLTELEVATGIIVGDVFHHLSKQLAIIWHKPALHVGAQQVAQQTAEILMARITQERTRVSEHTDKTAQQSQY